MRGPAGRVWTSVTDAACMATAVISTVGPALDAWASGSDDVGTSGAWFPGSCQARLTWRRMPKRSARACSGSDRAPSALEPSPGAAREGRGVWGAVATALAPGDKQVRPRRDGDRWSSPTASGAVAGLARGSGPHPVVPRAGPARPGSACLGKRPELARHACLLHFGRWKDLRSESEGGGGFCQEIHFRVQGPAHHPARCCPGSPGICPAQFMLCPGSRSRVLRSAGVPLPV